MRCLYCILWHLCLGSETAGIKRAWQLFYNFAVFQKNPLISNAQNNYADISSCFLYVNKLTREAVGYQTVTLKYLYLPIPNNHPKPSSQFQDFSAHKALKIEIENYCLYFK